MRVIGCDVGQARDYSAIVVVERDDDVYRIEGIERPPLGTPYGYLVQRLGVLAGPGDRVALDWTGCGRPVLEMARAAGVNALGVCITGGTVAQVDRNEATVPKRDLVGTAQVLLQNRRLKASRALPLAATLISELRSFRMKVNIQTGNESFEAWRERDHDDLVLALCLALWTWENLGGPLRIEAVRIHAGDRVRLF